MVLRRRVIRRRIGILKAAGIAQSAGLVGGLAATAPLLTPRLPLVARVAVAGGGVIGGFVVGGLATGLAFRAGRRILRRRRKMR